MGDPSGRGLAMSFLKNMKRLGKDPVNRILGKQDGAASIMGTNSDLRKLPNKQVRSKPLHMNLNLNGNLILEVGR